jgi:molybdopterin biosynthesis enzyme MoaB
VTVDIERRTPGNTAIVLIDYVTGFANLFRSQSVQENVSGAVALAKTAAVIGDHPVIHRAARLMLSISLASRRRSPKRA